MTDRILAAPHRFVGQERLPLSQAPTWGASGRTSGVAAPRPVTLRTFTLRYGSAYRPLVGGLASVVESTDRGGVPVSSKDVWVLKESASDPDQGLADVLPMTSARSVSVLVPRILEDMFWLGRYAERAEDMLRLVLTAHAYAEDFRTRPRTTGGTTLDVLLGAVHRLAGPGPAPHPDLDDEFRSLLLDAERVGSVAHSLAGLRDALQGVRDQLSGDMWRGFGTIDRAAEALLAQPHSHQVAESAGRMLTGILALQGVTASMMRDPGWHMIGAGRYLERSLQVCHLLAATTTVRRGIDVDREVLNAVLDRRRERGHPPASLPRLRPPGRRARAAADGPRQPAVAGLLPRASCAPTWPRSRPRPARPGPSGCSPTCTPSSGAPTSPRWSRSAASAGPTWWRSWRRPRPP